MMIRRIIEAAFPDLRISGYRVTSPDTVGYNCVAWAAGDTSRWWWPDSLETSYWPDDVQRSETLEAFVRAFETLSYTTCDAPEYEEGFERIAIYVNANGKPTHAVRQLPSGYWSSKLGQSYDIEHDLEGVSGSQYGSVGVIMKRLRKLQD